MFKLLSRSVPKSNRSLTKFSNIYKKIRNAFHNNTLQHQQNGPKNHSRNPEDNSQRGAKKFEVTFKTSRTFSTSCVGKTGLKFLKKSLFPEKCKEKVKLVMFSSTSSSRYFYSSTMNQTKHNNKKYFKNHRALELYKKAFEQCMKIKFEKHRIDRSNNKIGWTPEPFKVDYPQELVVISDKKKAEATPKRMKPEEKIPRQVLRLIPKKSLTVKEMAQKRKALEQKKLTSNNIKKKMKIVYPTHIIKHNLGLSTSYHVDKSIRSKIEILSNATNKRAKKSKNKVEVNTVEVIPIKQELNQNLLKIMSAIKKRREKICEENAQTDDAIKHLISQHPTVKKATKAAKMSINKKYNVILLKSQAKVQLKMLKPEELIEENVTIEEIPAEELKTAPTEANESIIDKITEKPIIDRNQPGIDSKITQHPILPNKFQTYPEETVRYPKKILVDKTETFDIDGICLRTKESYVAYVNEDGETLAKIPNYPEVVNTNLRKEQEKITPEHRKKPNLKAVEAQGNVSIKMNPDNIDTIKKIENFTKSRSSQEKKQDLEANVYVSKSKNQIKTISPTQCVLHYLKKLNELKDQTAVDRLTPNKYTNRKSIMVENLEVKKLNKDGKNKIISGEKVDVKKIGTVSEDTKRKEFRSETENVTKLEDATGIDKKVTQKIKDDRSVEKNMKRSMNTEKATHKDLIEKTADFTCPKSGQIGVEETNEIHPSEVKPLYEKLLERNREQVSANQRKKFKLKLDQNMLKRKSEAKRKVIISQVKLMTDPTSTKPLSTRKTSKYLLENYQPVTEIKTTEEKNSEKEEDKVIPTENKIFKKILQQYTVMSKTDIGNEDTQIIQDEPRGMKETKRKKGVSENGSNLENNFDNDVHVYDTKTPTTELKIHSIAVEKQNYSGNDLTLSTETFPEDVKPTDTKDVRKDYTFESKYTEKLKNLLEPANQYLEKLKEAGENQMKSLGDLKTHFKNQLSENIGRNLKIKQLIENTSRENDNLNDDKVAKLPDNSGKMSREGDLGKNELIEVKKNQPSSTVDSKSNVVDTSPNEFMGNIYLREDKHVPHQTHKYALQAYQNIKAKDVTKSANLAEKSEEGYGIQKSVEELKKPSQNRLSLDQASDTTTEMNDEKVKTMEYLSRVNEDNVVKGINPLRKEYTRDEPSKKFDGGVRDNDSTMKETFFYILKEKEPEQDDLETNIIETKNKVDSDNVPKILKEELKDNHIPHSTRNISDHSEGLFSEYHIEDDKHHDNLLQNEATCLSQNDKHPPEKSLTSQKVSVFEHNISSSHSTNLNDFDNSGKIRDQDFPQSIESTNKTHKLDESDGDQVIEPSAEKSQNSSYIYNLSQNFVMLHNRPTIRKENPPTNNPKTDHNKRDKPKTKKDLVLPPPKSGNTPKMVDGTSMAEESEKYVDRMRNVFNDKSAGKNSMEESKCLIKSQYRSLESENKNENQLHNLMEKIDLEDIVFSYRAKPRSHQNKLFKNWITILAFIEELEITYKDGSDPNLIKMSDEMKFHTKESDRKGLEFAKLIPIDKNEQKQTYSHQNETKDIDFTDEKINLLQVPQKSNRSLEKAIVENNTIVEHITRLKPEKSINSDDHATFPKNTIITDDLVFSYSPMKTEKPPFPKNNEEVVRNGSKQLVSNKKIDETSKDNQTQDIQTESTILSKKPKTNNVPKFPKKFKWPPKTTKKFKLPPGEKKRQRGSMKKIPNVSDDVSEPKLSRKKVWMPRESPEPKSSDRSENHESNKISVTSKLEVLRNEPRSVSNFLEDNLKNWKSMNNKSEGLLFRQNVSDFSSKTKSITSKTESSLLKTFLLDEDEEVQLPKICPEPNRNSRNTSPRIEGCLNKYSKEEESYFHSNSLLEKSGEDANFKESKCLSLKPLVNTSPHSSKSEDTKVYDKIVKSILPSKQTKPKKRSVSNCLEENLKTWKLLKPMPDTSYEGIDKKSTDGNNSLKFSRLVEIFSLDDSEYPDPDSSKHLKRAHTTIIPQMSKNSYLDKHKLRKEGIDNFKSTSRNDNQIYNKKLNKLTDSNTSDRKVITCPTTPRKKQKGQYYEKIHSERIYQDSEKYKSGCNSAVELNKPKKTDSLVPSRLKNAITETQLSSKSTLLKTYSLEKSYKPSKKTEALAKSIEHMNKIEKTTDCFSLYFRKARHLNKTGIKKEDDGANAKTIEGKPSKCLVTLTLPNIKSGKLEQVESRKDSNEPSKGYLEKILQTGNSGNYPKDVIIPSLKNVRLIECSSSSSSRNGEFQKGRSDASKNGFNGNNGDDNRKKGAPKLLMRVVLPKNRYILENKTNINGIQLQKNEPDPQKDGKGPGKLKTKAIFKLSRTFGLPGKHRLSENRLENILKVSKVSYDRNTSRNTPLGAKNSNLKEHSQIPSNKSKASLKVTEGKQINLKDNTLRERYSTVHLNSIMDKYRVNNEKLQDLNDQNVVLTEVELFERRRSKERLLEAFNKKIRNNSKIVRKKVEKITIERIMRSIKKQNKLNFRSPIAKQVKIRPNCNTLVENKKSVGEVSAKKSLHGDMTIGKTKHRKKQHQYEDNHNLGSDIHQGITAGSDKVEQRENKGIKSIHKSNKETVKKIKFLLTKPKCYSLEYDMVGQGKGKRSKKNMYLLRNSMKYQGVGKRQKVKSKYGKYCLENQLTQMNKEKPIEANEMNTIKEISKYTNYFKIKSKKHDEPKVKLDEKNHAVKKITSKMKVSGKEAEKLFYKYLLERPMSSQCLDFINSGKGNEQISPVSSIENEASVYRPTSSKYSLENQNFVYRNSLVPNERFNVTKKFSADKMKGKFETSAKLIEKETRQMNQAKIQEILPKMYVVMNPADFGERNMNPVRSSVSLNKVPGFQDYSEHTVVAKIENILDNGQKISNVHKKRNSNSSSSCVHQMKFRHFNKFLIAEQKSGVADNGKMAEIDQQQTIELDHKIPERGRKLLDMNAPQKSPASNPDKIPGENKKIKSMKLIPKGNNTRSSKVVVEKNLPLYPLVEVKASKQAVTKFCYKIQIPPKSIMQVLLSQPRSDVTTLTKNPCREIMALPKKSNAKCRNLKITYIRVNRKPEKFDESFLPALIPTKEGNKTSNEKFDFQMNKEQILKLRYQLLKQLREEFEILNEKQIDRMLQSGTEKNDNMSEFKFKLSENKAIDDGNLPKNNTEMLIKKLTEKDRLEKKGEPEKPEGDPEKK